MGKHQIAGFFSFTKHWVRMQIFNPLNSEWFDLLVEGFRIFGQPTNGSFDPLVNISVLPTAIGSLPHF
jgi:hypothetical protein